MKPLVKAKADPAAAPVVNEMPVRIRIAQDGQIFYVHPGVLRKHSPYFTAALKNEWKEGKEGAISMEDVESSVFETYVQWLYGGKVHAPKIENEYATVLNQLAKLYALGEKVLDDEFKDRVLDALMATSLEKDFCKVLRHSGIDVVDTIYRATTQGSPGRRLIVDMFLIHGKQAWPEQSGVAWNGEFMIDLTVGLMDSHTMNPGYKLQYCTKNREDYRSFRTEQCAYHSHGKDKKCTVYEL